MALAGGSGQASLRGGSAGGGRARAGGGRRAGAGGSGGRRAGGCSRKSPPQAPGAESGGPGEAASPSAPLRSAPPQVAAHEEGPLLSPPRSPPAERGSAGPAAAGEAWRPGPDASRSVALPLRQPPTTKTFLRPAEPKTNRVRRGPRPTRPQPPPGLALPGPEVGGGTRDAPGLRSLPYLQRSGRHSDWKPTRCSSRGAAGEGRGSGGRAGGGGGRSRPRRGLTKGKARWPPSASGRAAAQAREADSAPARCAR